MRKGRVIAGCLAAVLVSATGGCTVREEPPADVTQPLTQRVSDLMAHDFSESIAPHHTGSFTCASHVFGVDPSTARSAADVEEVYAWVFCEETLPSGQTGDGIEVPVAIHLTTPPSLELPEDGEDYADSVAKIFPASLQGTADSAPPYVQDLIQQVRAARPSPTAQHS
jgi:hypothetical protein